MKAALFAVVAAAALVNLAIYVAFSNPFNAVLFVALVVLAWWLVVFA